MNEAPRGNIDLDQSTPLPRGAAVPANACRRILAFDQGLRESERYAFSNSLHLRRTIMAEAKSPLPSLDPPSRRTATMRYAIHLLLVSVLSFAVAFGLRRAFFWDIKPVSWDETPPQNGALEAAFLLLSIENVSAVVAAIALVYVAVTWSKARLRSGGG
jgi:hypothetical protein